MFSKTSNGINKENGKQLLVMLLVISFTAAIFFSLAPKASASLPFVGKLDVNEYVPLAPIEGTTNGPCSTSNPSDPNCKTNLGTYLTGMFKVGVAGAGVLAFLMIVWGGFTYLSTDAITGKEEGKAYIERAIGGLILALTSFIILNTINPDLVELDLTFGGPANPAGDIAAPSEESYEKRLDKKIAEINKILNETKTTAQTLEKTALDAALERNEIFRAYAEGELDDLSLAEQQQVLDRVKVLDNTIKTSKTQAQAVRDYNTAVAVIKNSRFEGIEAATKESGAKRDEQVNLHIQAIQNKAKTEIKNLEKAAATDLAHKQQYQTWADDLRSKFGESIRAIRKAEGKAADKDLQDLQSATMFL